jgi:predicted alternative tryptophan synthase beta-subunit
MHSVVTGAQAGGSAIPEAIAMESATEEVEVAVPVAKVTEGTVPEPEAAVAAKVVVGVHVDALPEASTKVVVRSPKV